MCIAIVKPKDKIIPKEVLRTCAEANPDGMGFAYCKGNTIYMYKNLNDFEKFYEKYAEVETTSNMLIHFRIATHGNVEINNCHPFVLNKRMVLIHNGIISGYGSKTENKSDTKDFIEKVIGNISYKQWDNPSFRQLVGEAIGYSKFGILDVTGKYFIINEHKGFWDDGVWYSNKSYKPKEVVTTKKSSVYDYSKRYDDDDEYYYDWKKDTSSSYKSIFYCDGCKKTFYIDGYKHQAQCPHCKSLSTDNVGYQTKGKDYFYDYSWCGV